MKVPEQNRGLAEQDPEVLLAMVCWGEARNQSPLGKAAVCHSILNRCKQKQRAIWQVVTKKWQYTSLMPSDPNYPKLFKPVEHDGLGAWAACWTAATEAMTGLSADPTNGATHYCVKGLWNLPPARPSRPKWHEAPPIASGTTVKKAEIGDHVFATTPW